MTVASAVLDADFAPIVQALTQLSPAAHRSIEDIRATWEAAAFGDIEQVPETRDLTMAAGDRHIAARLYRPGPAPEALIVYFHGGGWIAGSVATHDLPLRALANAAGMAILSVDYRLAPEHPFPAAFDDACAALDWAAAECHRLVPDAGHLPLIVGGDSAGGNLAAAAALAARDRGGPALAAQLLLYPALDGRCDAPSHVERAEGGLLTSADMRWYWEQYVPDPAARRHWSASPSAATDLGAMPATIVVTAEFDPLRDEGRAYAERLAAAGNRVVRLHHASLPHGFINMITIAPGARRALDEIVAALRRTIASGGDTR